MKNYTTSPLPFQGQKRNFVKLFKEALKDYPEDAIYVDLFGGSGLLSHVVKTEKPKAQVIYNDYDNFKRRLESIPLTNKILSEIRSIFGYRKKQSRMPLEDKNTILKIIKTHEKEGNYIDYITLSSNLLFSMHFVTSFDELEKKTFYHRVRKTGYSAEGYLKGVQTVSTDYKKLFEDFKENSNVVFLVDPPYLSTDCASYNNYQSLKEHLALAKTLINNNYFYFTSNKSGLVDFFERAKNDGVVNPFNGAKVENRYNVTSYNTSYTDIMIHKKHTV